MNSVDTPDEPIPLLFDGVPNTAEGIAALNDNALRSTRPTNSSVPSCTGSSPSRTAPPPPPARGADPTRRRRSTVSP